MMSALVFAACGGGAGGALDAAPGDAASGDAASGADAAADARPAKPAPNADPSTSLVFIAPCVVSGSDCGHVSLAYVDATGVVQVLRRTATTWSRIDVTAANQLDHAAEQVAPIFSGNWPLALMVRFSDGSISFVYGGWTREDASYATLAVPATTSFGATSGTYYSAIYGGTDGKFHDLRSPGGPFKDVVVPDAPAPIGPLASTYDGLTLYAAAGGEPTWVVGQQTTYAIHKLAGAPAMVGRGAVGYCETAECMAYRDAAGGIHVATTAGAVRTLAIGAPAAVSDLSAGEYRSQSPSQKVFAVAYRTATGAPVVLERAGDATWTWVDPTAGLTDAPAAKGNPVVAWDMYDLMVAYVGTDDHVHLLDRTGVGTTWTHVDVTAAAP
jgi:hypothetical protein